MTPLREVAHKVSKAPLSPLRLPELPQIMAVAEQLATAGTAADGPAAGRDYDAIALDLLLRVKEGATLSARDLRDAAWSLWTTEPALAQYADILERILAGIANSRRRRPGRALASSYVASFGRERTGIEAVGRTLREIASRLGRPWEGLQREVNVFHEQNGPSRVATLAIEESVPPTQILRRHGLAALDAQSGFANACAAAVLQHCAEGRVPDPERRLDLVVSTSLTPDRKLYFPDHGPLVANALIRPFGDSEPDEEIQEKYLVVLLQLFGDPRLHPERWARMPEAEAVVRRWLTKQSLRQFLDVVDRVAIKRMWKYRRAFWEAVYDERVVSAAWVVFDPLGAAEARRAFGPEASFGQFRRGSLIERGHSVLLLRIGAGVVADWSHNGKCNIWNNAEARGAPRLYQPTYKASELRIAGTVTDNLYEPTFTVVHGGAATYHWQRKVADKIYQMTGVRVPQTKYRVE